MNRPSRRENLSKRETRLLAFLFEHRGEVVTIEQIADLLWPDPDSTPDTYQSLIYNMISHLRANGVPVENVTGYRL